MCLNFETNRWINAKGFFKEFAKKRPEMKTTQRTLSFDETSMDSCPLAAIGDETRGNDLSKDGNEVEVTSLEEAKSVIAALRARQRAQAHQMLAWRRTLKLQEDLVARLTREKAEQLRTLSSQLLLFESRLCRKQKEIELVWRKGSPLFSDNRG